MDASPQFRTVSMSKATNAKLATELARMLAGATMVHPNPVETEIEKRNHEFIEDADNLFVLKSAAGRSAAHFENSVLKKLQHAQSITKIYLYPVPGWDEEDPVFDFTGFSQLVGKYMPMVTALLLQHMLVKHFELKSWPQLKELTLVDPQCQDGKWNLELENLEVLIMENHVPPAKNFAASVVQCPKIRRFFAHKLWAEETLPSLYLPNCTDFTFRRGDCVDKLSLYLPRVRTLNLDANYDLRVLNFLKQGHARHAQWNLPTQAEQSKFNLSCLNAALGPKVHQALLSSGRLLNDIREECEDDSMSDVEMEEGEEEEDMEDDDFDPSIAGPELLGRKVKVVHLKSRKDLVGKEGKVVEVYPDKDRIGVWFLHTKGLELSIPLASVEVLHTEPPRKCLNEID